MKGFRGRDYDDICSTKNYMINGFYIRLNYYSRIIKRSTRKTLLMILKKNNFLSEKSPMCDLRATIDYSYKSSEI